MPRRWTATLALGLTLGLASGALGACSTGPQSELSSRPTSAPASRATTTTPVDPAIVALMDGAAMTPSARRIFLAASPALEDKDKLAVSCAGLDTTASGTAHTYGCVVRGTVHIRLFSAPELHDMIYVVAAHELLHVVYARLGVAERVSLDAELRLARTSNAALEERLRVYAASDDDTPNEVHSVLGTEFAALPPELEGHYAGFFNRTVVLAAFARTLGDREAEIRRLGALVDEMKDRLDTMSAEMDALRSTGDLRAFNARVPTYNALVRQHNAAIDELQAKVAEHKQLVAG